MMVSPQIHRASMRKLLAVALAYFVSGTLGLKLAVPPGYATAIFPPSGIALAAVLLLGARIWPAVLAGSALMNLHVSLASGPLTLQAGFLSLGIGIGATLQAVAGGFLVRRFVPGFRSLYDEKSVLRFVLLAGPLASVVNATVSVSLLAGLGLVSSPTYLFNWTMWWIGDSIGAMVFAPLVVAAAEGGVSRWPQRKLLAILPSTLLFFLVVWVFFFSSRQLSEKLRLELKQTADSSAAQIDSYLKRYQLVIAGVERLFFTRTGHGSVGREEFRTFVSTALESVNGLRAISFNPRVPKADRQAYEDRARRAIGQRNYRIHELGPDGISTVAAGERPFYYPVLYVEPETANAAVFGFDATASGVRLQALDKAIRLGKPVATDRVRIVQEQESADVASVRFYHPIYTRDPSGLSEEERVRYCAGVAVGALRIKDLVGAALQGGSLPGLNLVITDLTDGVPAPLYSRISPEDRGRFPDERALAEHPPKEVYSAATISFGERLWRLDLFPSERYLAEHTDLSAWSVLAGGLILVVLLQSLLLVSTGRGVLVQNLVEQQTAEILQSSRELERSREELRQSHYQMELRVEQRTAELQASEEAARSANERLETVISNTDVVLFAFDRDGVMRFSDGKGLRSIGLNSGERVGKSIFEVHRDRPDILSAVREVLAGRRVDRRLCYNDRWFDVHYNPVFDDSGGIKGAVGISFDVTERQLAEKRLSESEEERARLEVEKKAADDASKLKSEFLANMSHEIRTPLNGVIGMTGLILDSELSQEQREYADNIKRSAESLLTVINDILDFSKVDAGKLELESIEFDLERSIRETLKSVELLAQKRGLGLVLEMDRSPESSLVGDPERIRQVLTNLLGNAIKFTLQGEVRVRVRTLGEAAESARYRFEVMDTGIGISKNALGRLFQPFSQADASTNRKFGGSGLGLSICKRLVELMSGTMGASSAEGSGSVFWFELELAKGLRSLGTLRSDDTLVTSSHVKGARILVAEDNEINKMLALRLLHKMGCHAEAVSNGREAFEALGRASFDAILMDCQMPEMDGYEACRLIRASERPEFRSIPIIAMTASAIKGDRERCLEAGMDDYISKPAKLHEVVGVLEKWLARGGARALRGGKKAA